MEKNDEPVSHIFIIEDIQVGTRCGYHDVIYRDSVLVVSVDIFNPSMNPVQETIEFSVDGVVKDMKAVSLNASEEVRIEFTTLPDIYNDFPLESIHLDTVGLHWVTIANQSKNFSVHPPVLTIEIEEVEWRENIQGYIPWIQLHVENPSDQLFFLGGSFGLQSKDGVLEAVVETWNPQQGVGNQTGYYKLPSGGRASVKLACYGLTSSFPDGSDIILKNIVVYAGFPWMDYTGGIIGEASLEEK